MDQEIRDVIAKHLPEHLSKSLQDRLADGDIAIEESKDLSAKLRRLTETCDKHGAAITEYKAREEEVARIELELSAAEDSLRQRELKLENSILEIKLAESNRLTDFIHGYTQTLVGNSVARGGGQPVQLSVPTERKWNEAFGGQVDVSAGQTVAIRNSYGAVEVYVGPVSVSCVEWMDIT